MPSGVGFAQEFLGETAALVTAQPKEYLYAATALTNEAVESGEVDDMEGFVNHAKATLMQVEQWRRFNNFVYVNRAIANDRGTIFAAYREMKIASLILRRHCAKLKSLDLKVELRFAPLVDENEGTVMLLWCQVTSLKHSRTVVEMAAAPRPNSASGARYRIKIVGGLIGAIHGALRCVKVASCPLNFARNLNISV